MGRCVSSGSADVASVSPATLTGEETAQRLVSLQRVVNGLRIVSLVTVEVSEKLSSLDGETLDLRLKGVLGEIFHVCIIPQKGVIVKGKGGKTSGFFPIAVDVLVLHAPVRIIVEIILPLSVVHDLALLENIVVIVALVRVIVVVFELVHEVYYTLSGVSCQALSQDSLR